MPLCDVARWLHPLPILEMSLGLQRSWRVAVLESRAGFICSFSPFSVSPGEAGCHVVHWADLIGDRCNCSLHQCRIMISCVSSGTLYCPANEGAQDPGQTCKNVGLSWVICDMWSPYMCGISVEAEYHCSKHLPHLLPSPVLGGCPAAF